MTSPPNGYKLLSSSIQDHYLSFDKFRVVVVGDTTVGKTSLLSLITNGKVLDRPTWTLGCNTFLKSHEYRSKEYFVEFVDVGGSVKYKITRPIFYTPINGLVVVYDLTNKNSLVNVKKWIFEVLNKLSSSGTSWTLHETENPHLLELENTQFIQTKQPNIPLLILGNKSDLYYDKNYIENDKLGRLSIPVSANIVGGFQKGSNNFNILDSFFNKIIMNMIGPKKRSLSSFQNLLNFNISNTGSSGNTSSPSSSTATSPTSLFMEQFEKQQQQQQQHQNHNSSIKMDSSPPLKPISPTSAYLESMSQNIIPIPSPRPLTSPPQLVNSNNNTINNNSNNSIDPNQFITRQLPTSHRSRSTSFEKWNINNH